MTFPAVDHLSFLILTVCIAKTQAIGTATYLDVRYGEGEFQACPKDDGWFSFRKSHLTATLV